ncbi:hypothetical protein PGT21_020079 [Puccinia graminis f. sp. tritici]|uniref:Uncharacterized protein n=1 Tax=Puccinia graminis f. sp. tritici TaxID=56615 RepID=A0A5B0LKR8_PUCGR|nr:hypothetical protein PGT21_020079 [Puccinia graminis f. sp. tritici]
MSEQTRQVSNDSCFVGPITSLQLLSSTHNDRLLLVGSGSFLSVFSLAACSSRNPEPVLYRKLLAADRIHHIKPLEYHGEQPEEERRAESPFVCAGGREFAICSIECLAEVDAKDGETTHPSRWVFHKLKAFAINDWIIDIDYLGRPSHEHTQIALLTAHNRLVFYKFEAPEQLQETNSVSCQDTTLLMSGQIRIRAQDQHLLFCIAAGSISGNVTLWEWSAENQGHDAIEPVQTTLIGHKGAIYDLAYSPLGEMLSTASEDRSVRVWDLTNLGASPIVLWGHLGRVWRVHWWNSEQLTSVGEDCRALTWRFSTSCKNPDTLECESNPLSRSSLKPFSTIQLAHDGRSVWSVTHDPETGCLLTGGADGKICSNFVEPNNPPEIISKRITSMNQIPIKAFNVSRDVSRIVYVCQDGSIYARSLFDKECLEKFVYSHPSISRSQCHVRFAPGSNETVYVATNQGWLVAIDGLGGCQPKIQIHNLEHTITMFTICVTRNSVSALIYDCKRHACLLYDVSTNDDPKLKFRMCLRSLKTPTSMTLLETKDPGRLLIFVGDVKGCLAVGEASKREGQVGPIVSLHEDGILDIRLDQQARDSTSNCFKNALSLHTLGRDGNLISCYIQVVNINEIRIFQIHQNPIGKGSLEAFLDRPGSLRYIGGFEKAQWNIFDCQTGSMIGSCKVACNGQPNMWFCRNNGSQSLLFYQQQGSILINCVSLPNRNSPIHSIPDSGTHGREINCLKVISIFQGLLEIVATGSENGVLELSLNQRQCTSQPLATVYRNARIPFAVKCLAWLKIPTQCEVTGRLWCDGHQGHRETLFLIISGSREMFQTFRVTLDRRPDASSTHEIDVGVMHWFSFSQRSAEESEVRIMDLDRLHLGDATWLLSTSQSDGNIRVWSLDVNKKKQQLLFQHKTNYCVFSIELLQIKVLNERETLILAGSADGAVRVLALPKIDIAAIEEGKVLEEQRMEMLLMLPCHQSGVRCVKSHSQNERVIIATGGDDNSLVVQCLGFSRNQATGSLEAKMTMAKKPHAHASCINDLFVLGFDFLDKGKEDMRRLSLFSVSADQKLKIWEIDPMLLEINLTKVFPSDVADCSSIDVACLETGPQQLPNQGPHNACIFLAGIGIERRLITTTTNTTSKSMLL